VSPITAASASRTRYRALLDEVVKRWPNNSCCRRHMKLSEIAERLGYAEPAPSFCFQALERYSPDRYRAVTGPDAWDDRVVGSPLILGSIAVNTVFAWKIPTQAASLRF